MSALWNIYTEISTYLLCCDFPLYFPKVYCNYMYDKVDITCIQTEFGGSRTASLYIYGGKQVYSANYFETYAPVMTWFTIWYMIIVACAMGQINFVQAHAPAPIKCDMNMELPPSIEMKQRSSKAYVLKLLMICKLNCESVHDW